MVMDDTEGIEKFWEKILKESMSVQNNPQITKSHLRQYMCAVFPFIFFFSF